MNQLRIKTPTYLRKINPTEYPVEGKGYLNMVIKLSNHNKSLKSTEFHFRLELILAEIYLFDTGVATVNLEFEIVFDTELEPKGILAAYKMIYNKIKEPLSKKQDVNIRDDKKAETEALSELNRIYNIIKNIINNVGIWKEGEKAHLLAGGQAWTLAPYTLFCIPKIHIDKVTKFFSLLYLDENISNSDPIIAKNLHLEDFDKQYNESTDNHHFITNVKAALLIDNDKSDIEVYVDYIKFCSYIYLSAVLFRSYLVTKLDDLSKEFDTYTYNINKSENIQNKILEVDKLRMKAISIIQLKYQFYLYLWDETDLIFDKILEEAWHTEVELYQRIKETIELLDSIYQSLANRKQTELNSKITNGLSLLTVMGIPFALFFAALTWSNSDSMCTTINSFSISPEINCNYFFIGLISSIPFLTLICYGIYRKYLRYVIFDFPRTRETKTRAKSQ